MAHGLAFWSPIVLQPIGTVIVGIAASAIALRQWVVANEKFRFDLFEKRFEVYQSASHCLGVLVTQGDENIKLESIESLEAIILLSRLFFGHAVYRSIQDAATAGRQLMGIRKSSDEYRMLPETIDRQTKLFSRIEHANTAACKIMEDFIDFSRIGRPAYYGKFWHFRRNLSMAYDENRRLIRGWYKRKFRDMLKQHQR